MPPLCEAVLILQFLLLLRVLSSLFMWEGHDLETAGACLSTMDAQGPGRSPFSHSTLRSQSRN